ncbi:MAG: cellulase family glycosylhydrolase [Bacteroidota bacterium]
MFDLAISEMKQRGMKFVITPIAFWGNGYPEPDEKTPGFSAKFGKDPCLVNPSAIKAQHNYLRQFLEHVNKYTGKAYKDDPDVIAFEISNEPHHKGTPAEVTTFITGMADAILKTGCSKPIFYNVSHSIHLAEAYYKAPIQGGTFQWYPTGLGARHELGGNLLPNVDRYPVPFADLPGYKKTTKIVYEFDAADVGRSYIYPAMTRTFRTAGMPVRNSLCLRSNIHGVYKHGV